MFHAFNLTDLSRSQQLYTSSYDCTLRKTNLETGYSEEVIDVDRWVEFGDGLIHAFDFNREGNQLWGEPSSSWASPAETVSLTTPLHQQLSTTMEVSCTATYASPCSRRGVGRPMAPKVSPSAPALISFKFADLD